MMNYYAFNLNIQSAIPLPLPVSQTKEKPDIVITVGELTEPTNMSKTFDGVWYSHGRNSLFLKWDHIGSYFIQNGKRITLTPCEDNSSLACSQVEPLLGTVIAVAIHQRAMASLHGSSVMEGDHALIFLGEKGQGKSTMAGYFKKEGHMLLSDDTCAINSKKDNNSWIQPSFPKIKLWPDAMHFLDYTPEEHQRVHSGFEKRNILLTTGFSSTPAKVAAIIVLKTGSTVALQPLTGHQALSTIMPHLIINRFPEKQPIELKKSIFSLSTRVINTTPIYQLERPRDISLLPASYEVIKNRN